MVGLYAAGEPTGEPAGWLPRRGLAALVVAAGVRQAAALAVCRACHLPRAAAPRCLLSAALCEFFGTYRIPVLPVLPGVLLDRALMACHSHDKSGSKFCFLFCANNAF